MHGKLAAAVVLVLVSGCSGEPNPPESGRGLGAAPPQARTSLPDDEVSVLEEDGPAALAIQVSRSLFEHTPVVVLAGEEDVPSQEQAAERAVELGVPLLLVSDGTDVSDELARLGAVSVIPVGDAAAEWAGQRGLMTTIPPLTPSQPLPGLVVMGPEAERTLAATATARAAGARVLHTDASDPRTDPELIEALAAEPPSHTLALGGEFGSVDRLRGRLAVAATGVQLPGGGQVLFPGRRFVALYGHPGAPVLGVLGEQPVEEAISRAEEVAGAYEELVDEPVVPAFEIITTVASSGPGPERDYSRRTPIDRVRRWVDAAGEAGMYVVLDLQPGRTDFLTQAKEYQQLLEEPHVGLALDPEWRLAPDQRHLEQIGSVDAAEVNRVVEWLADLTAEHRLPQKLLVLHQFTLQMIEDRARVETGRDELAVLIHADGFGTRAEKVNTWRALHADPPPDVWWGWKNFYDEDQPTFTPAQTVDVSPSPVFVSYQ